MKQYVIFDVGANDGRTFERYFGNSHYQIYLFEPTPKLCKDIRQWINQYSNVHLVESAVDADESPKTFHIAGQADWGCSSLHEFSDNLDKTWPERPDLKVTDTITVPCIRLDTFIECNKIDAIDYLHIDTQGNDLNVLKSLGDYVNIVKEGQIEVPMNDLVKLYKTQHRLEETREWLLSNGFVISNASSQQNEYNWYFKRK